MPQSAESLHPGHRLLRLAVDVRRGEVTALFWSWLYYFALMASYYPLRAVREEIGSRKGADGLTELFTATFLVMLFAAPGFSWLVSRFPRRIFLPIVYSVFSLAILIFYFLLRASDESEIRLVGGAYFVFISVFNLFVVSVFWGFMADLWRSDQGKRLFGFVAMGASAGAIAGAAIPSFLAEHIGSNQLLLISAGVLQVTQLCIWRLAGNDDRAAPASAVAARERPEDDISGGWWKLFTDVVASPYLLGIAGYVLLYTASSTLLYFIQAEVVNDAFSGRDQRTAVFGRISLATNILAMVVQGAITGRLMSRLGVAFTLVVLPAITLIGFVALALVPSMAGPDAVWWWGAAPILWVFVPFQVIRSASNYALSKPAREVLFTVVSRSEKYKAKVFIDTVIYRGGDAATAWALKPLESTAGLVALTAAGVPLTMVWIGLAIVLGIAQRRRAAAPPTPRQRGFEVL